ncbi:MAG: Cd(II)/Pb(II)-responsive transcriptional regulator [Pseudomonadota bacterium]|nr:Cd(II)/Pb(II)-responsive transcriptional regulator [Pseudomonadota bacterium]
MKIGELATATGTQIETIRYYEREGLLPQPARTEGNYRIYDEPHANRLLFVRHCRALDMNLDEIRILLRFRDTPVGDCGEVNALLDEHIGHVQQRMKELRNLDRDLRALRVLCTEAQEASQCGILNGLSSAAITGAGRAPSHVGHVHGANSGQRGPAAK